MRLIKLKIKNIASLKGEHEINFAEIQGQSPLFAITGETGSGKSSILNSIGLVLYGKVYKSNVQQLDLVTLGEKEGQIELLFQSKGKNYLAFWKARVRKQNGELYSTPQTPQRELYSVEGDDFSSPKTILITRTEELLNLDFDQFCKCIILNQGEFAKFLSSSFTERKEILEKLYPGEMFDKLSTKLKDEKNSLEKQINDLDVELHALKGEGFSGEDLSVLKDKLEADFKLHESWLKVIESMEFHYVSLHSLHTKNGEALSKIENIKSTLSKETSVLNDLMALVQKAAEEKNSVQLEQDKTLPGLQELLRSEETLRHTTEQKNETQKTEVRYQELSDQLKSRILKASEALKEWSVKSQALNSALTLPLVELKAHAPHFDSLFDQYTKKELLEQELTQKEDRLSQLEIQGKEEAQSLKEITHKKSELQNAKAELESVLAQKKELTHALELKQRNQIKMDELLLRKKEALNEQTQIHERSLELSKGLKSLEQEHLPLATTLKLETLLNAVEVCLTHPSLEETHACPVCKSQLAESTVIELRKSIQKTDLSQIKAKEAELGRKMIHLESEIQQLKDKAQKLVLDLNLKDKEEASYREILNSPLQDPLILEAQMAEASKKVWEQDKIASEELRLTQVLTKTREQYAALKSDIAIKSQLKAGTQEIIQKLLAPMNFIKELNSEVIQKLKAESRKLKEIGEHEALGSKIAQEKTHLEENAKEAEKNLLEAQKTLQDLTKKAHSLEEILLKELKGKKASELIQDLSQRLKDKIEFLGLKEKELKSQELKLKDSQSRLYILDEQIKDIDLHFTKEIHELKVLSKTGLPSLSEELTLLIQKLGTLSLELKSPHELFLPLKDLIDSQKSFYKEKTGQLKENLGSVRARLEDWEKRQDKITLLNLKLKDLTDLLDRRARLYEVLGKDELRTFVLSLVEENLITQTNDELQKLCQGRYEIVHQSRRMKLTPEFYILDKFREGGLRKVSTLSGGETFMVSLAMALGLAEMTRGKAEIDSLFIDEGFGTLDQDSLEDVLDMLKQIQTRGLMVGIISHVKALTNALPVNLQVTKKQDGTSSVGIVLN